MRFFRGIGYIYEQGECFFDDCETAERFYKKYRKLGGNIEIKFEDFCKE